MAESARVLIIDSGKILLLHRFKNGKEYYSLPGGNVGDNETISEAAVREAKEETDLTVVLGEKIWEYFNPYNQSMGYYFLVQSFTGEPMFLGPETQTSTNKYSLVWMPLAKLYSLTFYPEEIKTRIFEKFVVNS